MSAAQQARGPEKRCSSRVRRKVGAVTGADQHTACQARPKRVDARRSEPVALEAAAALLSVNAGQG